MLVRNLDYVYRLLCDIIIMIDSVENENIENYTTLRKNSMYRTFKYHLIILRLLYTPPHRQPTRILQPILPIFPQPHPPQPYTSSPIPPISTILNLF